MVLPWGICQSIFPQVAMVKFMCIYRFLIYRNIREMRLSLRRQLPVVKHGKRMACEQIHHPGILNRKKLRFVRHLTIDQVVSLWASHQAVKCPPYLPPLHSFLSSFLCPMILTKNPRSPGTEIESGGREGQVPASNALTNKLLLLLLLGHIPSQLVLFQNHIIFSVHFIGMQWNMLTTELWWGMGQSWARRMDEWVAS